MASTAAVASIPAASVNRRRQGSLAGLLVCAVGASLLAWAATGETRTAYLFLTLGAAFAVAYRQGRQPYVYLVATCTFLAFGAGMTLAQAVPAAWGGAVFLATVALGPLVVFIVRPVRRWPIIVTLVLGPLAAAEALGVRVLPAAAEPYLVPLTLLVVGAYLIVGPRRS